MTRKHNSITRAVLTRNPNKRLRGWLPPAPGWNSRRCILELAAGGAWITRPAIRKKHPGMSFGAIDWRLQALVKAGCLERKHIEGRPVEPHWTRADWGLSRDGRQPAMRSKARWAYRITHAGLAHLEDLRAGKRDIIGRSRSAHYAALREWMPGRGPMPLRLVRARLGAGAWREAVRWCWHAYGNPRPLGGGLWVWHEWTVEELFS